MMTQRRAEALAVRCAVRCALPERLLIESIRMWLGDRREWRRIEIAFLSVLGPEDGRPALVAMESLVHALFHNARRILYFHRLQSDRVTTDERTFLTLVAAAQHDHWPHCMALAGWLLPACFQRQAVKDATVIAQALVNQGWRLPQPRRGASEPARTGRATVVPDVGRDIHRIKRRG